MLTIFAIPKPFVGRSELIQRNAIKSWKSLDASLNVLLMGNAEGTAEIAKEFGADHFGAIDLNDFGTPTVGSAFRIAREVARTPVLAYVNADIILTSTILKPIDSSPFSEYLISCERWDIDLDTDIDFTSQTWEKELAERAARLGRLNGPWSKDCFIFPREMYGNLPPFGIGRPGWDSWLVYWTRLNKIPVVDATSGIRIYHQNHDYSHIKGGLKSNSYAKELKMNYRLAGGRGLNFGLYSADWIYDGDGFRKQPMSVRKLLGIVESFPDLHPRTAPLLRPVQIFLNRLRNIVPMTVKDFLKEHILTSLHAKYLETPVENRYSRRGGF